MEVLILIQIKLILNSGEIPSDIYRQIDIPAATFRSAIAFLKKNGYIRRNFNDSFHTYLLNAKRKQYKNYREAYIKTTNILTARKRRARLARLNVYLEGMNVSTFLGDNPPIKEAVLNNYNLRFYNSYYLKLKATDFPEKIRRSKAFGLLCGHGKNILVYYEPTSIAADFYIEELLFRDVVYSYINSTVREMLLVVDTPSHAAFWTFFLMHHDEYFYGDRPSAYFDSVNILVADENAFESFVALYLEKGLLMVL